MKDTCGDLWRFRKCKDGHDDFPSCERSRPKVLVVALAVRALAACIMALHLLISSTTDHTTAMATKMTGAEVNHPRWAFWSRSTASFLVTEIPTQDLGVRD